MFRLQELSDQTGVGGIAFVAPQSLLTVSFDLAWINEIDCSQPRVGKSMRDGATVVTSLLQAGSELLRGGDRAQPLKKRANAFRSVVETLAEGFIGTDDVAKKIGLTDIDGEKESWSAGIDSSIFHGVLDVIGGHSKQLTAGESQSHQNRFKRSKMLLGLEGRECHVMPYLVHRLNRANGGLDGASDCITWLFWVPDWNKLLIDFRGVLSFFRFKGAFLPRNWRRSSTPACSPTALRLPLPTCASCEISVDAASAYPPYETALTNPDTRCELVDLSDWILYSAFERSLSGIGLAGLNVVAKKISVGEALRTGFGGWAGC